MIQKLRKNIGTIVACFGFILLCILTFGDLGEVLTKSYWINVKTNLTSIGFVSVSLTLIQMSIKQGVSEQALQKGLNTENTTKKYKEDRELIRDNSSRSIYLPYFLQIYNERNTLLKKREFLVDNNFKSEKELYDSHNKKQIKLYKSIRIYLTASRIKWATTDIVYNKHGQILTLAEHRVNRIKRGLLFTFLFMIGTTLLAKGLFFEESTTPITEKLVKLFTYVVIIAINSVLSIIREYEMGAFGVPTELEEINEVWREFESWEVPKWVKDEMEVLNEQEGVINVRTNIQVQSKESCLVDSIKSDNNVDNAGISDAIHVSDTEAFSGECYGDSKPIG